MFIMKSRVNPSLGLYVLRTTKCTSVWKRFNSTITFEELGVPKPLALAAEKLYGVKEPTELQKRLIPAIIQGGKDYLLIQETGSGKTFSILLAMLGMAYKDFLENSFVKSDETEKEKHALSSPMGVLLVPNRELALQIDEWATNLVQEAFPLAHKNNLVQTFIGGADYIEKQEKTLMEFGSPSLVVDGRLQRIFVDEVDSMIQLANREKRITSMLRKRLEAENRVEQFELQKSSTKPRQVAYLKSLAEKLWDGEKKSYILKELERIDYIQNPKYKPVEYKSTKFYSLFISSATVNSDLIKYLKSRGWFPTDLENIELKAQGSFVPSSIEHSCIVVDDLETVRNIKEKTLKQVSASTPFEKKAEQPFSSSTITDDSHLEQKVVDMFGVTDFNNGGNHLNSSFENIPVEQENDLAELSDLEEMAQKAIAKPKLKITEAQYNQYVTECIANVLGSEAESVKNVVIFMQTGKKYYDFLEALYKQGITAIGLFEKYTKTLPSENTSSSSKPTSKSYNVFITTDTAGRGIDIPDVSHVLILDVPKSKNSYIHMAGRTGRFNSTGKAITIVFNTSDSLPEGRMRGLYTQLNITPTKLAYLD
ncbi:ATP-dependent RNA helicase SrmB [Zancudomyces culisetae]|uniref:RNA helicase n=1 Tax=Zancudomyces culisetae TaxID=1213189 RepID=A0A1R1PK51_ZANCU|nr:ATP-dependent RNA helicase SrmB [Zancudomyces culisetae]OMH85565.1 ATP-dependent RNA helicase SrmB [Zancudomyces culisetae]|eukprot:OMH81345.1 ATP-dependent RNA helicase SrmB [Zancudomyces culisetae]